jgi:hypothetical protein
MDARENALEYIRLFEETVEVSAEDNEDDRFAIWEYGLLVSREWLRLIDSKHISDEEFRAFIGAVHANKYLSSAWGVMALDIFNWAIGKGFVLPDEWKFFYSPPFLHDFISIQDMTDVELAGELAALFEEKYLEDSKSPLWHEGHEISKKWTELIRSENVSPNDVNKLLARSLKYREIGITEFFILWVGLFRWTIKKGFVSTNEKTNSFLEIFDK